MHIEYEFEKLMQRTGGYFFQYAHARKLSDIYHSHDFFEIIIIVTGECEKKINGECSCFYRNDIIILRPGDSHVFLRQSEDIQIVSLSVRADEFTGLCGMYDENAADKICSKKSPIVFNSPDFPIRFFTLFPYFKHVFGEYDCIMFLSYVLKLYLSEGKGDESTVPLALSEAMERMKEAENIKQGISAFVRLSNYSQSQLSRLMKKHFGLSLHEYISDLRLSEALRLLTMTDMPMEEIGENVGYASFSHFNKIFKEKYGITPSLARKKNRMWTV